MGAHNPDTQHHTKMFTFRSIFFIVLGHCVYCYWSLMWRVWRRSAQLSISCNVIHTSILMWINAKDNFHVQKLFDIIFIYIHTRCQSIGTLCIIIIMKKRRRRRRRRRWRRRRKHAILPCIAPNAVGKIHSNIYSRFIFAICENANVISRMFVS